jgi:hypothetical protein
MEEFKRYIVFAYNQYYPSGGWNDYQGSYETVDEAKAAAKNLREGNFALHGWEYEYTQIVDLETGRTVEDDGQVQ